MADARRPRRAPRREKHSILIVTNGAVTEQLYLKEVKRRALLTQKARDENLSIKIHFVNGEPGSVLRKLSSPHGDTREYDEVWIVVDEDGEDRESFLHRCREKSTRKRPWTGVVSRPCFEVRLTAHYEQVRRYSDQADAQRHFRSVTPPGIGDKELPEDFPYDAVSEAAGRSHLPDASLPEAGAMPPSPGSSMPLLLGRLGLL
jgi:hypothetical protein